MVHLNTQVTGRIALTKYEGKPEFLDGNVLYFRYSSKMSEDDNLLYGCIDMSKTRKSVTPLQACDYPKLPIEPKFSVNDKLIYFGRWVALYLSTHSTRNFPAVRNGHHVNLDAAQISLHDFQQACKDIPAGARGDWNIEYVMEDTLSDGLSEFAWNKANREKLLTWRPMREIGLEDTAIVLEVFSFDGDKKSLVTSLKSSWGSELRDSDVKVDKHLTGKITGISSLEELIPRAGTKCQL